MNLLCTSVAAAALLLCLPVLAKLPAPSPEAKAKADEAAAKTAYANKVGAYQLCKSMDRVATAYFAQAKKDGRPVKPPVATDACADPGVFSYVPPAAPQPLEAAGAHSPAATAVAPPSSVTPQAAAKK